MRTQWGDARCRSIRWSSGQLILVGSEEIFTWDNYTLRIGAWDIKCTIIRDLPMLTMTMSGPYVITKGKMSKSMEDWTAGSLASSLTKAESLFLPALFSNDSCGRRERRYTRKITSHAQMVAGKINWHLPEMIRGWCRTWSLGPTPESIAQACRMSLRSTWAAPWCSGQIRAVWSGSGVAAQLQFHCHKSRMGPEAWLQDKIRSCKLLLSSSLLNTQKIGNNNFHLLLPRVRVLQILVEIVQPIKKIGKPPSKECQHITIAKLAEETQEITTHALKKLVIVTTQDSKGFFGNSA